VSTQGSLASTFAIPISSGIFAHCQKIGIAIWVFIWMIDRTTREVPSANGCSEGLVYNGRAIRAYEVGKELGMPARTIQAHLDRLVAHGYLRRINRTQGAASGYAVQRSKKWKPKLSVVGHEEQDPTPQIIAHSPQNPAKGAPFLAKTPQNPATTPPFSAPYIEDITHTLHRLNIVKEKSFDDAQPKLSSSLEVGKSLERRVKEGWDYFLDRTNKSSAQYLFSPERQKQGLKGFESLVAFVRRCKVSGDALDAASKLFRVAVDRLADSDFHNGKNDQGKQYLDWHQLFRSKDFPMPTKLVEYWLDDSRWTK
jgi:hypothetical protein